MSNIYCGISYRTQEEMADAIAEMWITADGANNAKQVNKSLASNTNDELADELLNDWPCDDQRPGEGQYDAKIIAAAFERFRAKWAEICDEYGEN